MIRLTGSTSRTCCVDCLSAKHNSALLGWGRRRPWSIWSVARGFCGWAKPATEAELSIRRVCKRWLSPIVWWPNAPMKPMLSRSNCYWDKSGHGRWNTDFIMAGYDKEIGFAKFCLSDRYIYLNMSYYIYSYWICFNHNAFYIKSPINYITERLNWQTSDRLTSHKPKTAAFHCAFDRFTSLNYSLWNVNEVFSGIWHTVDIIVCTCNAHQRVAGKVWLFIRLLLTKFPLPPIRGAECHSQSKPSGWTISGFFSPGRLRW